VAFPWWRAVVLTVVAGCATIQQRFPDDVAAAVARDSMRRLETDHFILYYPEQRHDEVRRFLARAERCSSTTRGQARIHEGAWNDKMVVVMPDVPFNNAFVAPESGGYEAVAVIPTYSTLDFTTEFGLVADPGLIACHELTHYTHFKQLAGLWRYMNEIFGNLYNPQDGFDPWMFEGLAVHYETALNPGVGRPTWPLFTGLFAAGYAGGQHVDGGELDVYKRQAEVGHHYLVGGMFVKFLAETYGEAALWKTIESEASGVIGVFAPQSFISGFGKSLPTLVDEFAAWTARVNPVRARPAAQRVLVDAIGNDARYTRGRDGTEAWVADDVDLPTRLVVRDPHGVELANIGLVEIVPPRLTVEAEPLLVSGLSVTADGSEVWLTAIDRSTTYETPRLLRWRRDSGLVEITRELGPGATIDPKGGVYYYCAVDGDRWSLAAYDAKTGARRTVRDMQPGTYVTGARSSPDGARLVADVYDGKQFAEWELDAHTGATLREIRGAGVEAVYDASYLGDGRLMWLGEVAGRFQVTVEGTVLTDAPYAAFQAREAGGTIRFLDREAWQWQLDEIAVPSVAPPAAPEPALAAPSIAMPLPATPVIQSDEPFSIFDHLFYPQIRAPLIYATSSNDNLAGVTLGGGDRLGLQRWALSGYLQPAVRGDDNVHYGGDAAYENLMLAPFRIYAEASQINWNEQLAANAPALFDGHRTRDLSLGLSRTFRETISVALAGIYTDDQQREAGFEPLLRHVGGPQLAVAYEGVESTRYTGTRRALEASAQVAYYPHDASSYLADIVDVGGALGVTAPLPVGRRHTLALRVRGRALVSSQDTGLLQLGGETALATLFNSNTAPGMPPAFDDTRLPPNLRYVETLRGYEDYAITTDRAGIADLTYRYPLIIDRGTASTFWIGPAAFVRELDLELFGAGAVDQQNELHAAVGGALTLSLAIWRVPLSLVYQVSRRLRDDDATVQLLGLGVQ
jgi:hypothetical protein